LVKIVKNSPCLKFKNSSETYKHRINKTHLQ